MAGASKIVHVNKGEAMKYKRVFILLICAMLAACTLPSYTHRGVDVQVLNPRDGQIFFTGNEIDVDAYSYSPGVENRTVSFNFFANSSAIGSIAASSGSDTSAKQGRLGWMPATAGEYQLQVEALIDDPTDDRGGVSRSVRICILDIPSRIIRENLGGDGLLAEGYGGPCPLPPARPTDPSDISFNFTAGPQASSFAFPTETCPDISTPAIYFTARVDRDPSDSLALIIVDVTWGARFSSTPLALTPSGTGAAGEKLFGGTWTPPDFYDGSSPLTWTAFAFSRTGGLLGRITGEIDMNACIPPITGKAEPDVTPTNTPASEADCGPGTYFAENTNQCIPIEIVTVKPGKDNSGQNACKDPGNCPYGWSQQNCSCK
jgi:hypothetical protein